MSVSVWPSVCVCVCVWECVHKLPRHVSSPCNTLCLSQGEVDHTMVQWSTRFSPDAPAEVVSAARDAVRSAFNELRRAVLGYDARMSHPAARTTRSHAVATVRCSVATACQGGRTQCRNCRRTTWPCSTASSVPSSARCRVSPVRARPALSRPASTLMRRRRSHIDAWVQCPSM